MAGVLETVREEDYVKYFLFLSEIDDVNANEETERVLENTILNIHSIVGKYAQEYIWHKDAFNVIPRNEHNAPLSIGFEIVEKDPLPSHIFGITHFGDNLEDEWFIVFLLQQLTKEIDGLVIRVVDSDGEFLLIEAAEVLPTWANPDTCEQRVYLYKGAVHIIPISDANDEENRLMPVREAVAQIRSNPQLTEASKSIQKVIQARIGEYPAKLNELIHRATAYVPIGVAALLKTRPNLIAPAVLAFCNRDPIDMKACRAMRYFAPETRVMASVVFTKCLYAMVTHHKYCPDRRTGWNMPTANSKEFAAHILGVKLACGFEILVAQGKPPSSSPLTPTTEDLFTDRSWLQYLSSLKKKGYFKDLLEGSVEYKSLLEKAETYFSSHRDFFQCTPSIGQEVLSLLGSLDLDADELRRAESNLPAPDDESWLELHPKDLDAMLEQRYGQRKFVSANSNTDPANISAHLAQFLDHISDLDGAEYPSSEMVGDDSPPVRPKRGIKLHKGKGKSPDVNSEATRQSDDEEPSAATGNKINFDSDSFSCAVQNILDFVIPDDSWDLESDGSGMSSYEDEMNMDLDQLKRGKEKKGQEEPESELKQYMDQMDQELASSTMGQSFEKACTSKGKSQATSGVPKEDSFDDIENFKPVDIDMNALKNILQSYQAQMGGAGPASNLLGPMGIRLEPQSPSTET